jgi:hypothetical protein
MKFAGIMAVLIGLLTVPGGIISAGNHQRADQTSHAPVQVLRKSDGRIARGIRGQMYSGNWSGYAVANFQTGVTYSSAQASWVVPSVQYDSNGGGSIQASGTWVGIGGFCQNKLCTRVDHTLIQLGTEEDVAQDGTTTYSAWYEMLPNPETPISGFTVNPGDVITASLSVVPSAAPVLAAAGGKPGGRSSGQTWALTLTNKTTTQIWTMNVPYKSSLLSAEWIEEAPSLSGGTLPLAKYSSPLTFDPDAVSDPDLSANGGLVTLSPTNAIVMLNPYGEYSNPSAPDTDDSGFNTCWGIGDQNSLATCPAPSD